MGQGDNATDGFALGLSQASDLIFEIPSALQGSAKNSDTVVEYVVGTDGVLQPIDSAIANLSGEEYSSASDYETDGENSVEGVSKKRKLERPISGKREATKVEAERKLAARIDGLWGATTFRNRVDIPRDLRVEIDPVSLELKAEAKCLLCDTWFIIRKPDYTYLIHNYKRHVTRCHVETAAPPLEPPQKNRCTGKGAALKKAANNPLQQSVKSFFAPSSNSMSNMVHNSTLGIEVLGNEGIDDHNGFILDATSGDFHCISKYSGNVSAHHALDSDAPRDVTEDLSPGQLEQSEELEEIQDSELTLSASSSDINPNGI